VDRYEGFDAFVVARGQALLRTAYLLTGDRHLAEDLLQSALARTFRHWGRVRDGAPEAYVRQAMVRENISWWRRRRLHEVVVADLPESEAATRSDVDQRIVLDAALRRLTSKQRAVLVLRFFDDLTEQQTAHVLGCSVGTVKSQSHRALARLRVDSPELSSLLDGDEADEPEEVRP
jgi:RNA polymerase sigma-70 factor (sigma-E family)